PRPWVRTAGAVTVDATDPVSAHTDAAAIATTVTASTSQPWGRAKRTGRSSSSGDWSLARACWRNCTGLPSPVETVRRTAEAELRERNGTRVRPGPGTAPPGPGAVERFRDPVCPKARSETGDQVGDRGGVPARSEERR